MEVDDLQPLVYLLKKRDKSASDKDAVLSRLLTHRAFDAVFMKLGTSLHIEKLQVFKCHADVRLFRISAC